MRRTHRSSNVICITVFLSALTFGADDQYYSSTYLGDSTGQSFWTEYFVSILNDNGDVIINRPLWYNTSATSSVLIRDGYAVDLEDPNWVSATAYGMSNNGIIVGSVLDGEGVWWAAYWTGWGWEVLDDAPEYSIARGVNDDGIVVGECAGTAPFLYDSEGFHDIDPEDTISSIFTMAVNASGMVMIGSSGDGAWVWDGVELLPILGPSGYTGLYAFDINDNGQVICLDTGAGLHAFIWQDDNGDDLILALNCDDTTWSYGWDINNSGEVVGATNLGVSVWTTVGMVSSTYSVVHAIGVASMDYAVRINEGGELLVRGDSHGQHGYMSMFLASQPPPEGSDEDTTPPTFGTYLVEFPEVGPPIPLVTVQVSDSASAIDWTTARVFIDGFLMPCGYSGDEILCGFDHELPSGLHRVDVFVCDAAGNAASINWTFLVGDADETDPVIDQTTPHGVVATDMPWISARISDEESWVNWWDFDPVIIATIIDLRQSKEITTRRDRASLRR